MKNTKECNKSIILVNEKKNIVITIMNKIKSFFNKSKTDKNQIKMVMFDLDGTLWNTEEVTYQVANEIVNNYEFLKEITKETVAKSMGVTFEETAEMFMPYLDKEKREDIFQEMLDLLANRLTIVGGAVFEGLKETLIELSKKYKVSIVSNCAAGYIESFLDSSNLGEFFVDFAAAGKMKISKAEAMKIVLQRNDIKNTEAVYLGDTIKDLEASKNAGIRFIHAKYGFGRNLVTDYFVDEIKELPELLIKLDK